jgi:hypothetical protein
LVALFLVISVALSEPIPGIYDLRFVIFDLGGGKRDPERNHEEHEEKLVSHQDAETAKAEALVVLRPASSVLRSPYPPWFKEELDSRFRGNDRVVAITRLLLSP